LEYYMAVRRPTSTSTQSASTSRSRPRRRRGASSGQPKVAESNNTVTASYDEIEPMVVPDNLTFADLGVPASLVSALSAAGVTKPFPIQAATLPDSLAGKDVLGRGRTGSGKTYAFVLPMLARLATSRSRRRSPR
jgi:superfamily II DNA/RNA helicase